MSRTDKDRPYWVRARAEGHLEHDHRTGECIPEDPTSHQVPLWSRRRRHAPVCAKRVETFYYCTPESPETFGWGERCWGTWIDAEYSWVPCAQTGDPIWTVTRLRRRRRGCEGHTVVTWAPGNACVCDQYPPSPTCYWAAESQWDSPTPQAVALGYHRPERRRARDELNEARRRYNGGDDLEGDRDGFDFVHRQGRSSVAWDWY